MKLNKLWSCVILCLATSGLCAAQGPDPRRETEERRVGRMPNPVVRRPGTQARRAPASARSKPQAEFDPRVEDALESANKARDAFDSDKAKEFYQRALAINPHDPRAYIGLGNVEMEDSIDYIKEEDFMAAIKRAEGYYKKALALSPNEWSANLGLGEVYDLLAVSDSGTDRRLQNRAEALFKKAISLNPAAVEAWRRLGILYENEKRFDEAEAAYRRGLDLKPQDKPTLGDLYFRLGDLLSNQNRHAEAAKVFQEWASADPKDVSPRYWLGMMYVKLGDKKAATEQYQTLRQMNSDRADNLLAEINKMKD